MVFNKYIKHINTEINRFDKMDVLFIAYVKQKNKWKKQFTKYIKKQIDISNIMFQYKYHVLFYRYTYD